MPDGCIEGLHTMYINDGMLVGGAFQPLHLVQWTDLGDLNRVIGAPNHLQRATVPTPGTSTEVQVPDGCIKGLHTMYINDAMLVGGAIQPLHLVQWANLGDLKRVIGAPNHLH